MRAFRVTWKDSACIVAAESATPAKLTAYYSACDVYGRRHVKYIDFRVQQAPEYDPWVAARRPRYPVGEENVKKEVADAAHPPS